MDIVTRCVDRFNAVADDTERSSLLAVASIFLKLAGSPFDLVELPGGKAMFLEKIARQIEEAEQAEAREKWRVQYVVEYILAALEARFGTFPDDVKAGVETIRSIAKLNHLHRVAATCPDLAAFAAELSADSKPGT